MSQKQIDQLEAWGYKVGVATEGGEYWANPETGSPVTEDFDGAEQRKRPTVHYIEGYGLATYIRSDDKEGWKSLVDKSAHKERKLQVDETQEQTLLRWHEDPDNEFKLEPEAHEQIKEAVANGN